MRVLTMARPSLAHAPGEFKLGVGGGILGSICCILHASALILGMGGASGFFAGLMLAYQPYFVGASVLFMAYLLWRQHRAGASISPRAVVLLGAAYVAMYYAATTFSRLVSAPGHM